ncbi:MAG: hypothetical protein M0Z30_10940 [Actinomycetota bacterium]|nr:hypothetical protein [Actinomycetota bacterium]
MMTSARSVPSASSRPEDDDSTVSLRSLQGALRRRRRFWLGSAVAGLMLGAAVHLVIPAKYSALAEVILIEPTGSDPTQAVANDQSILQSLAVAGKAVEALHLNESPAVFASSYRSTVVSSEVLSISLSARSPAQAKAQLAALAGAFLEFRAQEYSSQIGVELSALSSRSISLQNSITSLTASIDSASSPSAPSSSAAELSNLISARAGDETTLSSVQSQIQQDQLDVTSVTSDSRVLDPPSVTAKSATKVALTDGASGLVAGLGVGLMTVVLGAALSQGVRRRQALADALGAPVELSIVRWRKPRLLRTVRLSRRLLHPDAQQRAARARLRQHLDASPGGALAAVSVGSGDLAALAVAGLALDLASEGLRVAVVDLDAGHPLRRLLPRNQHYGRTISVPLNDPTAGFGSQPDPKEVGRTESSEGRPASWYQRGGYQLRARAVRREPGLGEVKLISGPADPLDPPSETPGDVDVVLTLATVEPDRGADHVARWATDVVVVVTAGAAPLTRIHAVGEMLRRANLRVKASILVNPDSDDDSLGQADDRLKADVGDPDLTAPGAWLGAGGHR